MPRQTKAMLEKENLAMHRRITRLEKQLAQIEQIQAALRESEERFTRAFHGSATAQVISFVETGQILDINAAGCRLLGYAYDEIVGHTIMELGLWADSLDQQKKYRQLREQGGPGHYEIQTQTHSGEIRTLLVSSEPIELKGMQCLITTGVDITDRKHLKRALRENEEKYSAIFYQSIIPAALLRIPENIFVDVNDAIERTFGYSRREVIGKNSVEAGFFQPAERDRVYAEFQQGNLVNGIEAQFFKKSGDMLVAIIKANQVEFGGQKYIMISIQDITERKLAEYELSHTHAQLHQLSRQLLKAQEQERQIIARELHDEIGQTLTALKLLLEMAQRPPVEQSRNRLEQACNIVDELIERTSRLSLDLHPPILDDHRILPALLWLTDTFTSQTQFRIDLAHEGVQDKLFDPIVTSTVYRLVQAALTNVARHAGVNYALVRISADDARLELIIEDAGCGFDIKSVWLRRECVGLVGMSERVQLLNGDFNVDSAPGHGTRVTIHLPLDAQARQELQL
jgi:PAS domain S-box-containing protein